MKVQLLRLLEAAEMRNVAIQVMPTETWAHNGVIGPMLLLETADRRMIAYTEAQGISAVITDPEEVSAFVQRFGIIRAQAMSTEQSAHFINRLVGDYDQ